MVQFCVAILETLHSTQGKIILTLRQRILSKHCLLRFLCLSIEIHLSHVPQTTTKTTIKKTGPWRTFIYTLLHSIHTEHGVRGTQYKYTYVTTACVASGTIYIFKKFNQILITMKNRGRVIFCMTVTIINLYLTGRYNNVCGIQVTQVKANGSSLGHIYL